MRYAVETTHAVPIEEVALYIVRKSTVLLCPECHERLGICVNERERAILEACHDCKVRPRHFGPLPSEPFN